MPIFVFLEGNSKLALSWKWGRESAWNTTLLPQNILVTVSGIHNKKPLPSLIAVTSKLLTPGIGIFASKMILLLLLFFGHLHVQQIMYNGLLEPYLGFLLKFCLALTTSKQCSACYYTALGAKVYAMSRLS